MSTSRPLDELPARQEKAKAELGRYLTRRERACLFKSRHTERSAQREARRLLAKGETRIRAYQCPLDPTHWHVGRIKRDTE